MSSSLLAAIQRDQPVVGVRKQRFQRGLVAVEKIRPVKISGVRVVRAEVEGQLSRIVRTASASRRKCEGSHIRGLRGDHVPIRGNAVERRRWFILPCGESGRCIEYILRRGEDREGVTTSDRLYRVCLGAIHHQRAAFAITILRGERPVERYHHQDEGTVAVGYADVERAIRHNE